ncbi:bifunctional phosphoglucose/phosphomannose isomerase [Sulfolobus sp. E5]|nr:bifunctional phosphoglucose/phosphomannose isomerase [Sulfolobus sp. E5]
MDDIYLKWDKLFDEAFKLPVFDIKNDIIIFSGIGGSGIVGEIANILDLGIRFDKKFKGNETLIAVSYSGNTSETISDVYNAISSGSEVIVITSGGLLEKIANEKKLNIIKVPSGFQTRYAFPYLFTPLTRMISMRRGIKLIMEELKDGVIKARDKVIEESKRLVELILPSRIPVFYSSRYLSIAKRFKQEINENAKYPAFFGEIPEVNHNEIESYVHGKSLSPIVIESNEIDKITEEVLNAIVIKPYFKSDLMNISSLLMLAGLSSFEMAKRLNETPDKLYNIPTARKLTSNLFRLS